MPLIIYSLGSGHTHAHTLTQICIPMFHTEETRFKNAGLKFVDLYADYCLWNTFLPYILMPYSSKFDYFYDLE